MVSEKPIGSHDFLEHTMDYRIIQPAGTLFGYMPKTDNKQHMLKYRDIRVMEYKIVVCSS